MLRHSWPDNDISPLIDLALAEDLSLPYIDLTTQHLFPEMDFAPAKVEIINKANTDIIACGLPILEHLLPKLPYPYHIDYHYHDGDTVPQNHTLVTIEANAKAALMLERTILNFLRHLSGIAQLTHCFVNKVAGTPLKILDTRKTTPGFRRLEKYAVQCGGGVNHRMGLYDAIMVKDTHIDVLGSLELALDKLPEPHENSPDVVVEIRNSRELDTLLSHAPHKVTRVLLDNHSLHALEQAVIRCEGKVQTEASGNLCLDTIRDVANTGVEFASVGCITHSAPQADLSMRSAVTTLKSEE